MAILREDLFVAFFTAARSSNLATLSNVCQVALSLYAHLGSHLLLQVRAGSGCPVGSSPAYRPHRISFSISISACQELD